MPKDDDVVTLPACSHRLYLGYFTRIRLRIPLAASVVRSVGGVAGADTFAAWGYGATACSRVLEPIKQREGRCQAESETLPSPDAGAALRAAGYRETMQTGEGSSSRTTAAKPIWGAPSCG